MQHTADQKFEKYVMKLKTRFWKKCSYMSILAYIYNILSLQKIMFLDMQKRCTEGSKVSCMSKVPYVISWKFWAWDWTQDVNPFPLCLLWQSWLLLRNQISNWQKIFGNEMNSWKSMATLHLCEFKTDISVLVNRPLCIF